MQIALEYGYVGYGSCIAMSQPGVFTCGMADETAPSRGIFNFFFLQTQGHLESGSPFGQVSYLGDWNFVKENGECISWIGMNKMGGKKSSSVEMTKVFRS